MHKLIITTNSLRNLGAKCGAIAAQSAVIPVLEYALITVTPGMVTFRATDMETSIETKSGCESAGGFSFLWNVKDINDLCAKLPEMSIAIYYEEVGYKIHLETMAGDFDYTSEAATTFPELPKDINSVSFDITDGFVEKMKVASNFVSADNLRPSTTGVLFDIKGDAANGFSLHIVATDFHSLYLSEGLFLFDAEQPYQAVVPAKTIKRLAALEIKGEVSVSISDSHIRFSAGVTDIYARLIDHKFPDYNAIVPNYTGYFTTDLKAITQSLSLAMIQSNNTTKQIDFILEELKITLIATNDDYGKKGKMAPITVKATINDMKFSLNGQMTQNILKNLKANPIILNDCAPTKAFIFKDSSCNDIFLLMPLQKMPNK